MWNLHHLAKEYSQRPSSVIGVDDEWAAYQFDLATLRLAQHVEAEQRKGLPLHVILGAPDAARPRAHYASFKSLRAPRRMRVPPSGVW